MGNQAVNAGKLSCRYARLTEWRHGQMIFQGSRDCRNGG